MVRKTIFFDLDGTLTDPKPGITRSIQYALTRLNKPVPTEDELTWCIGPPLRESLVSMLGEVDADEGLRLYRERFGDVGLYENTIYPGVRETLEHLAARDLNLFVASSKPHVYVHRILDHFGLSEFFVDVYGAELDGTRSDKAQLLSYALELSGADAGSSLMLGDRKHDIVGAIANGLTPIGVTYGYGSVAELETAGARELLDSFEQVSGISLVMS